MHNRHIATIRKHARAQINSNGMGAVEQFLSESISVATVDDEILLRKKSDRYLWYNTQWGLRFAELLDENSVLQLSICNYEISYSRSAIESLDVFNIRNLYQFYLSEFEKHGLTTPRSSSSPQNVYGPHWPFLILLFHHHILKNAFKFERWVHVLKWASAELANHSNLLHPIKLDPLLVWSVHNRNERFFLERDLNQR